MLARTLKLTSYNNSYFLFGPRQVGKTHLLKTILKPDLYIDLLKNTEFSRYIQSPELLNKEVQSLPGTSQQVVVDEIQRCPALLNEVHHLMEAGGEIQFILTGSSARKLRRGGVNLLGGRALTLHLYPLTHEELDKLFELEAVLHFGSLPKIILSPNAISRRRLLKAYVETYLKEEIQQEALTRNLPAFSKFLTLAAFENGQVLNFNQLARAVGVSAKTVKEYYQILEDTLLGFFLYPYSRSQRKRLLKHPKFYFFDTGVVRALRQELTVPLIPATPPYGLAFEHWVLVELRRLLDYREREVRVEFFRTSDGTEVDIILQYPKETWAIEVKSHSSPQAKHLRGLKSFFKDHQPQRSLCVCQTPRAYREGGIEFLPWREFFKQV